MQPNAAVTYDLLSATDLSAFEQLYDIYERSLPKRERKPRAEISAAASRPDYQILLAKRDSAAIGFSMLFLPIEHGFGLLEYMAVDRAHRSAGLGGELFRRTVQIARDTRGSIPMLLEVDSDRELSFDQQMRRRRQQFYRRLGCRRIDGLPYLLPLPGEGPAPEMDMFVCTPTHYPPLSKSVLVRWLGVVYERVYNCSPDDSRIATMAESVVDPVVLI